jgi:acyl dehydratase
MSMIVEGPYFDELSPGQVFDTAPALTLTPGHAATHQAVVGDRLRLALDATLARDVTGSAPLAHPGLVWDVAIGQSTLATHHVKANLFYRGLVLRRAPLIGDTLRTVTEVVALRQKSRSPRDRAGCAADHHDRPGGASRTGFLAVRDAPVARSGPPASAAAVGGVPTVSRSASCPVSARQREPDGVSAVQRAGTGTADPQEALRCGPGVGARVWLDRPSSQPRHPPPRACLGQLSAVGG